MKMQRIHLFVEGRVQGVGFRFAAQQEALRLELTGWVRNLGDGRVEGFAQGTQKAVEEWTEWCKTGPSGAKVTQVKVAEIEEEEAFFPSDSFVIR